MWDQWSDRGLHYNIPEWFSARGYRIYKKILWFILILSKHRFTIPFYISHYHTLTTQPLVIPCYQLPGVGSRGRLNLLVVVLWECCPIIPSEISGSLFLSVAFCDLTWWHSGLKGFWLSFLKLFRITASIHLYCSSDWLKMVNFASDWLWPF